MSTTKSYVFSGAWLTIIVHWICNICTELKPKTFVLKISFYISPNLWISGASLNYTQCQPKSVSGSNIFGECGEEYKSVDVHCDADFNIKNASSDRYRTHCNNSDSDWDDHLLCGNISELPRQISNC